MRTTQLHAVLGSIAVTVGFWLVWGELPVALVAAVALAVAGFLAWQGTTIAHVWAWACLLVGFASAAWPVATMVRVRMETAAAAEPSDEQMGLILTAVVAGLISSVFWVSFGSGIFRWIKRKEAEQAEVEAKAQVADGKRSQKQSQNRR
jgi:hypothetical protein